MAESKSTGAVFNENAGHTTFIKDGDTIIGRDVGDVRELWFIADLPDTSTTPVQWFQFPTGVRMGDVNYVVSLHCTVVNSSFDQHDLPILQPVDVGMLGFLWKIRQSDAGVYTNANSKMHIRIIGKKPTS